MQLDTFLEIGNQHKVCEDYIVAGYDPAPYIILSDGCSTANNSEMGSRILCHLAKQYLKYNKDDLYDIDYWKLGQWVIHNAEQTVRQLGLSISCLTATLIVAYYLDGEVRIMMYGDGSYIKMFDNENFDLTSVEYSGNAPYYLVYEIDTFRNDLYMQKSPTKQIKYTYTDGSTSIEEFAYDHPFDISFRMNTMEGILIASDGIDSFLQATTPIPATDVIPSFIAFKNLKGEFLKRRLNKQMKVYGRDNIGHFDDLSVGAFLKVEEI